MPFVSTSDGLPGLDLTTETWKYDVYHHVNVGVISGRVDDEDETLLKEAGVNLSEVVRAAAHERARRLRQERALRWLTEHAVDVGTRSEDLVRAGRDA